MNAYERAVAVGGKLTTGVVKRADHGWPTGLVTRHYVLDHLWVAMPRGEHYLATRRFDTLEQAAEYLRIIAEEGP